MVLMGVFLATVPSVDGGLHPAFAMMVYSVIFMLIGVCCYIGEAAIGIFTDFSFLHVIRLLVIAVAGYALFNDLLPGGRDMSYCFCGFIYYGMQGSFRL